VAKTARAIGMYWQREEPSMAIALVALILAAAAPARGVVFEYGNATIPAGAVGQVSVWLRTGGAEVAGVQNDIRFPAGMHTVAAAQGPWPRPSGGSACRVNPDIRKELAVRVLWSDDGGGERLRAIVLSIANMGPIADGALLYTCDVFVPADTKPGRYPLGAQALGASDASGRALPAHGRAGAVYVVARDASDAPLLYRRMPGESRRPGNVPNEAAPDVATRPTGRPKARPTPFPTTGRAPATARPTPTATPSS
jgi:hypothetical protein